MKNFLFLGGYIALLFLAGLSSCTKQDEPAQQQCARCLLISEKSIAGKLMAIDTLWNDIACGVDLERVRQQKPDSFFNCDIQMNEKLYYVITQRR